MTDAPKSDLTRRGLGLGLVGALAACDAASAPQANAQPVRRAPIELRRGIGVHNMLNWAEYEPGPGHNYLWPPFQSASYQVSDAEMANLRRIGFDFVRLTVAPDIFMASSGQRSRDLANILVDRVQRFRAHDLKVVVDLHPTYRNPLYTGDTLWQGAGSLVFRRYVEIVGEVAAALAPFDEGVALELMNEPQAYGMGAAHRWRSMTLRMIASARAEAPDLPLVVSGHMAGSDTGLIESQPYDDPRLMYTFHHYGPLLFTHQTAIDEARYISKLPWPAREGAVDNEIAAATRRINADRSLSQQQRQAQIARTTEALRRYFADDPGPQDLAADFSAVAAWADRNRVARDAIFLGEFGVVRFHGGYQGAMNAHRLRWLETMRTEAERNDFGWSVWVYRGAGGMALADQGDVLNLDAPSLSALGLNAG